GVESSMSAKPHATPDQAATLTALFRADMNSRPVSYDGAALGDRPFILQYSLSEAAYCKGSLLAEAKFRRGATLESRSRHARIAFAGALTLAAGNPPPVGSLARRRLLNA